MAYVEAGLRVAESSATTGTGALTLTGAIDASYQRFSAVMSVADTCHYAIVDDSLQWEVGLGTYSSTNVLTRTTVIASSNANAAISCTATKTVWLGDPGFSRAIAALTGKTTPTGADIMGIADSAASNAGKGLTLTNLALWLLASPSITGTATLAGLLDISGAAAGQIKFPATQNASANANTLDDYEEGTWTPAIGGTATYTVQTGRYVKVGKAVTAWCRLIINVLGTGSTTTVSGLPFASVNSGQAQPGCMGYFSALAISVVTLDCNAVNNSATVQFNSLAAAATGVTSAAAIFGGSTEVNFTITYEVA